MIKKSMQAALALSLAATVGCSKSSDDKKETQDAAPEQRETVQIPVNLTELGASAGLNLVDADEVAVEVLNCASQNYIDTVINAGNPELTLYKGDVGCEVNVKSFTVGSKVYSLQSAWPSYTAPTWTTFVSGALEMYVQLNTTLSSPIDANDSINLSFSQVTEGVSQVVDSSVFTQQEGVVVSGDEAPNFNISNTGFAGINGDGTGIVSIQLACAPEEVLGLPATCGSVATADMDYIFIPDNLAPEFVFNQTTLTTLFGESMDTYGDDVLRTISAAELAAQSSAIVLGTTGDLSTLVPFATEQDYLLVLRNGNSYKYFRITYNYVPTP